ncbi:MAG: DUF7948 domain-containing protein, partial [Bacteroidia bacterium]
MYFRNITTLITSSLYNIANRAIYTFLVFTLFSLSFKTVQAQNQKTLHTPQQSFLRNVSDKWCITENKGQQEAATVYYAELPGANISFQKDRIRFSLLEPGKADDHNTVMEMQFLHVNPLVQIIGEEKLPEDI